MAEPQQRGSNGSAEAKRQQRRSRSEERNGGADGS